MLFCSFPGISADGVYQAKGFRQTINEGNRVFIKQVSWDASHWINLAVTDVRDGKIGSSEKFFSKFIERTNSFAEVLNRGKGESSLSFYRLVVVIIDFCLGLEHSIPDSVREIDTLVVPAAQSIK